MTQYKGVDIFKFIFAFCVVWIHIEVFIPEKYPPTVDWLLKLAVPFFFIATGFLLRNKSSDYANVSSFLLKRSGHIAVLFVLWILIYLPIDICEIYRLNRFNTDEVSRYIIHLSLFGEGYYSWPLWYLYSLCIGLFLMALASRISRGIPGLFLTLALVQAFGWMSNKAGLESAPNIIVKALIDRGLLGGVFIILGWWLNQMKGLRNLSIGVTLIISSLALYFFDLGYGIYRALGAGGFFIISLQIKNICYSTITMRKLSVWLFYTHMYAIYLIIRISSFIHHPFSSIQFSLGACTLAFLLAMTIYFASLKYKVLNKLI